MSLSRRFEEIEMTASEMSPAWCMPVHTQRVRTIYAESQSAILLRTRSRRVRACSGTNGRSARPGPPGPWCAGTSRSRWNRHRGAMTRHSAVKCHMGSWCGGIDRVADVRWHSCGFPFCGCRLCSAREIRLTGGAGVPVHLSGGEQDGAIDGDGEKLNFVAIH